MSFGEMPLRETSLGETLFGETLLFGFCGNIVRGNVFRRIAVVPKQCVILRWAERLNLLDGSLWIYGHARISGKLLPNIYLKFKVHWIAPTKVPLWRKIKAPKNVSNLSSLSVSSDNLIAQKQGDQNWRIFTLFCYLKITEVTQKYAQFSTV
jgi:hypothetical protein